MSSRPCLLVCLSLTTATTTLDDIERAAGLHRATTATTTLDDIERAAGLHRAGSIDDVEYAELKRQLLSAGRHAAGRSIAGPFFGKGTPDGLIPAGREFELFSYTVQGDSGAVLTQFQYYGTGDPLEESGFNDTRIRYYVDGESVASVDYLLYLAHGMGAQGRPLHAAWGTRRWGSSIGDRPSVYNTIRVPFTTSIRITAQLPKRITRTQRFWLDLFGCEALPISIGGGILLPPREYRLRLHKNEATRLPMQEYISVVDTNSNGGIFYFLTISSRSPNATSSGSAYSFLEVCPPSPLPHAQPAPARPPRRPCLSLDSALTLAPSSSHTPHAARRVGSGAMAAVRPKTRSC